MASTDAIIWEALGLVLIGALSGMLYCLVSDARTVPVILVRVFAIMALLLGLEQMLLSFFFGHFSNTRMWALLCVVWVGLLLLRRWAAILGCGMVGFCFLWEFFDAIERIIRHSFALSDALQAGMELVAIALLMGVLHFVGPRLHPGL